MSVGFASRVRLVWEIKVRFVRVCTRNGPCVGKGRGLNGGVVQSGASGRPPSDPHPRSEPLLDASHSERTPLLAVRNVPQLPLSIALCCHLPRCIVHCSEQPPASLARSSSLARVAHPPLPRTSSPPTLPPSRCYSSRLSVFIRRPYAFPSPRSPCRRPGC